MQEIDGRKVTETNTIPLGQIITSGIIPAPIELRDWDGLKGRVVHVLYCHRGLNTAFDHYLLQPEAPVVRRPIFAEDVPTWMQGGWSFEYEGAWEIVDVSRVRLELAQFENEDAGTAATV